MRLIWMVQIVTILFLPGCFLIDKLDDMDEEPQKNYDPGTEPASQAFSSNPTMNIQLASVEGVGVTIPPNALVSPTGILPTTYISIVLTNHLYESSQPWNMPGGFLALDAAGLPVALTTFGAIEITAIGMDDTLLNLQTGVNAQIEIPALPNGLATASLWYLDEERNIWLQSGTATLNDTRYWGQVNHFSKWCVSTSAARTCVTGTVLDGNGLPVGNAIITAKKTTGAGLNGGQVYTNQQGVFTIEGLIGGNSYEITTYGQNCSDSLLVDLPAANAECIPLDTLTLSNGGIPAETTLAGSCDSTATQGFCIDYTGVDFTADYVLSLCGGSTPPAAYFETPCSRFNAIGICTQNAGMPNETTKVFDTDRFTIDTAQAACTNTNGIFSTL